MRSWLRPHWLNMAIIRFFSKASGIRYPAMGTPTMPITPRVPRTERNSHLESGSVWVVAPACRLFFCTHLATPNSSSPSWERSGEASGGSARKDPPAQRIEDWPVKQPAELFRGHAKAVQLCLALL